MRRVHNKYIQIQIHTQTHNIYLFIDIFACVTHTQYAHIHHFAHIQYNNNNRFIGMFCHIFCVMNAACRMFALRKVLDRHSLHIFALMMSSSSSLLLLLLFASRYPTMRVCAFAPESVCGVSNVDTMFESRASNVCP